MQKVIPSKPKEIYGFKKKKKKKIRDHGRKKQKCRRKVEKGRASDLQKPFSLSLNLSPSPPSLHLSALSLQTLQLQQ